MTNALTLMMPVLPNTQWTTLATTLAGAQPQIDAALKSIGTVHFARFLLLDASKPNLLIDTTNTAPSNTLVIGVVTEYDGDFNAYISDFSTQLGAVFDALLHFVVGGAALTPVVNNLAAFEAFITANDGSQHAPNTNSYAAYPQTVQQILAAV